MNCPKCGNEIKPNMKFCAKCGTAVMVSAQSREYAQMRPAVSTQNNEFAQQTFAKKTANAEFLQTASDMKSNSIKTKKKINPGKIAAIVIAAVLAAAILITGGVFVFDAVMYKKETAGEGYITDFPILKQNTQLLVYDEEKFPAEEYEIRIERSQNGGIFKSSTFTSYTIVSREKSTNPIFNIKFPQDGKYRIILEDITASRTQQVSSANEQTTKSPKALDKIIIEVTVDDSSAEAVDKVTINSKQGDKPVDFNISGSGNSQRGIVFGQTLSANGSYAVAVKADGTVVATGQNYDGRCNVESWTDVISVSSGGSHTVGLKADGTVVAVGDNERGQCNVQDWKDIVAISAGWCHTLGLKADGTVVSTEYIELDTDDEWNAYDGQCEVDGWKNIAQISTKMNYSLGLKSDGTAVATAIPHLGPEFPYNVYHGQCDVTDWTDLVLISASDIATVGVKKDGSVVTTSSSEKAEISKWRDIIAAETGWGYTVGLKNDGTVVATTLQEGQLAANYGQTDVSGWRNIVAIATCDEATFGLRSDGTVLFCGSDHEGEIDVSSWKNIAIPGTAYNPNVDLPKDPEPTLSPKDTYAENAELYNRYLINGGLEEVFENAMVEMDNNLELRYCLIDIDEDGCYELVLRIRDTEWQATEDLLYGIQNGQVVLLEHDGLSGGTAGGAVLSIKYDNVDKKHVVVLDGHGRDGALLWYSWWEPIQYDGKSTIKPDLYQSEGYLLETYYPYEEEIETIKKETSLYYVDDNGRLFIYKRNDQYISQDEYDKNVTNRYSDPTDEKYQMKSGTLENPLGL